MAGNNYTNHSSERLLTSLNLKFNRLNKSYKDLSELNDSRLDVISQYDNDTLREEEQFSSGERFLKSKFVAISGVPIMLFIGGAVTWNYRKDIHDFRNRYLPDFHSNYDDYLQYGPAITALGLNLSGVKGRHQFGRATVNYAYSTAISSIVVRILKLSTHVLRPDGSAYNSFPSGHTTTAFMSATFLHKEYGQYVDPRYSILGYTMAIGTGIGRQTNDRHWISDVLVGAGIGILSTEAAYLLADKIHGDWGLNLKQPSSNYYNSSDKPSFINIKMGIANSLFHQVSGHVNTNLDPGIAMGLEGAWFFKKQFGIGAQVSFLSYAFNMSGSNIGFTGFEEYFIDQISFQSIGTTYLLVGPYFYHSLNDFWALSGKGNIGLTLGAKGVAISEVKPGYINLLGQKQTVMKFYPGKDVGFAADFAIHRKISRTVNVKGFIEYFHTSPYIFLKEIESIDIDSGSVSFKSWDKIGKLNSHSLVFGLSLVAMLW